MMSPSGTTRKALALQRFLPESEGMVLCVLTYNLTCVLNIVGVENLMEAIKA